MERPSAASSDGARLILYCVNPHAYELVRHWAERAGHHLSLIVTSPGPKRARSTGYRQIIAQAPPEQDLLVTTGMRRTAPLLAALEPDLILSFTLPFRLPLEVRTLPRHGAVNLHPAPLPAYRGPNPARMIFDGAPTLGATLHRTAEEFDTGAILSRQEAPTPAAITRATVLEVWAALLRQALDEGVARALADEPGTPQEEAGASYAASFAPEERWLEWTLPATTLQRRAIALNLFEVQARAWIEGHAYLLDEAEALPEVAAALPGTVLQRAERTVTVQTGQGALRAVATAL